MDRHRRSPWTDSSLSLLARGYAWLPDLRRHHPGPVARARLMGRPAVALHGPEAVRFFYDERHVVRDGALPEPVKSTLFGHGAVHSLDGAVHRLRKAMFLSLLADPDRVRSLVRAVETVWDASVPAWAEQPRVVLLDEAARVLTEGVCRWAGVPLSDGDAEPFARDLVAMVDGFATPGPRHWRGRSARRRREARLARLVNGVREGAVEVPTDCAVAVIARHRDADGELLAPRVAAVELLNVLRPTVAVCWFTAFVGHALHRWPENRDRLAGDDGPYAAAFAQEVRRFYPFAPFVGGRAAADLTFGDEPVGKGTLVLLDLYGQNHDPALWDDPYAFRPDRFLSRPGDLDLLVPQGGGDPATGHRCPGEAVVVGLLETLARRLARLEYTVPDQDLTISLARMIARPSSGFVLEPARPSGPLHAS
ncbi:cytochrome P450 [Kitasatospora cineracea]|uniref:Fatty-acid peroxygenase n=1 Tax=Kitasatospora cineracea TaxID=88074 RepID=A0A8G1X9U5_9ACTN|nr:cytochrome P450 [Kitasatospora cineracea]ROR35835.1 fatty-acid peroxygenase [Kitasatospora cineracea]